MAFGKKYYSSYKSNNNLDYYLEIWLEGHTGGNTELVMGQGGPVIEYETEQEDRFSPILSSSCKIPYLVEDTVDSAFIDTLRTTYQEKQVYIHIYRANSSSYHTTAPLWSGFLVMDIGSGVDQFFPYTQTLKFVDGLSLLKDIDFVDLDVAGGTPPFEERVQGNYARENMYFGPGTYIFWIKEILAKSGAALTNQGSTVNYGFTTSVNWYNGEMNTTGQSSDPLHKTKCAVSMFHRQDDQGVFYPDNCYNVLKELLRHWGARITYWKHEFWIVQIPEYITNESGTISSPVNNNSRLYSNTGSFQGSQNHLGDTYYTRYEQTIENAKISKLTGTKYDYLPIIKQVNADFLSFSSKNYFGGFPFGGTATTQEVWQGTINSPSAADFLYLSIPLNWSWDLSNAPNFPNGHTNGWWCSVKFNFYASDGTTTYYLQYLSSGGGRYFWVDSANWSPLGNRSPRYIISSKLADVYGHIGFEQQIPFEDENGNPISMSGAWSFFFDIEDYGNSNSNPGSFYINFSGYGSPQRMRNPGTAIQLPAGSGNMSGTVSWSNTLQDAQGQINISTVINPAGFNAGTLNPDIRFATTSPFLGLLQTLSNTTSVSFGETFNTINTNTQAQENSEQYNFGTLLWGDSVEFAPSSLQVFNGTIYENTAASGLWGRGVLTGTQTFTEILVDEFFSGQTQILISPSMRLAVGDANKNQDQGGTIRPRYVNPIGKLRETRLNAVDPVYFFRRGSFYTLLDEWDYEGYQIIRNVPTTTTQSNGMGSMGGSQSGSTAPAGMSPSPMVQALSQNSPLAYISNTIPATGSDVAVNGNFNTAVGWTLGTGWSIDTTAKKAKFAATGSTSELTQSVLTQGLTYQVNFQVEVTAGTLLVKAGTSGTSESITSSGIYSIYLDCEGSSLIKFQAGTTFTGNITYITLKDQKSLSSVPIEVIGTAVFKSGDTFNLINSNDDEILPLTVTSNQGSTDTTISVSSTPLYADIGNGSYLLINQDDLSEQYQNKTKGTVGGFDITATSIDSGSVSIGSYIDDDTFGTASATSLATSESIKAYVDGQVGASDTLQEVTDNGNTTTNSVMIGSASSPSEKLHVVGDALITGDAMADALKPAATGEPIKFKNFGSTELARFTDGGNLLIGTTTDSGAKLNLQGSLQVGVNDTGYDVTFYGATSGRYLLWDESANKLLHRDNVKGVFGNASDLQIFHDSYNSYIYHGGTGNLYIKNETNDKDIILQCDDGSGGITAYLTLDGSQATINLQKNVLIGTTTDLGYSLQIGSGDILAAYNYAKASFGQQSGSGDVHFGSSGNGSPTVGLQDYGFYAAHNAYRSSTGAWVHSRTSTIPAVRLLGSGGVASGNAGFSFDYSANQGSGNITWTNLMQILPSGDTTIAGDITTTSGNVNIGTIGKLLELHNENVGLYRGEGSSLILGGYDNVIFKSSNTVGITNQTERVRITSTGRMGIGLTNPISALDVNGTISLSNNSENKLYNASTSPANGTTTNTTVLYGRQIDLYALDDIVFRTGTSSNDDIIFFAGNSEKARMKGNGNILIATTTDSGLYKLDVFGKARVQSVFELDDVLTLNAISTPADPASGKSSIYMDSADGAIKVKINVGGTVVTRTIASYE